MSPGGRGSRRGRSTSSTPRARWCGSGAVGIEMLKMIESRGVPFNEVRGVALTFSAVLALTFFPQQRSDRRPAAPARAAGEGGC